MTRMGRWLLPVGLPVLVLGCSRFMHLNDPTLEDIAARICNEKAEARRAQLEQEAERRGIGIDTLLEIFKSACLLRMKEGEQAGERAGLAAVRSKLGESE